MSHGKQRSQKDCLNCGTIVEGKFCQNCGQENIVPTESFWSLITHFFNDITHFDGKLFSTLKVMFTKPGFLSKEYVNGRRGRYLHPIRMYVFTSAIYFIFFYAALSSKINLDTTTGLLDRAVTDSIITNLAQKQLTDSFSTDNAKSIVLLSSDSVSLSKAGLKALKDSGFTYERLKRVTEGREKFIKKLSKESQEKFKNKDQKEVVNDLLQNFIHKFPYIFFISLPLVALLLYLLYVKRREMHFFHHAIFTIHWYIFLFIISILFFILVKLFGESISGVVLIIVLLGILAYTLLALKKFYGGKWINTIIKWIALLTLSAVILFVLTIIVIIIQLIILGGVG